MHRLIFLLALFLFAQAASAEPVTTADRRQALANAARLLEDRYVDPALGKRLARQLRDAGRRWDGISDPQAFANAVTTWLRRESGDGHLGLSYSAKPLAENGSAQSFEADMQRWYGPGVNHGVERIERLPGNIMLLDLRVFPPPAMGGDVLAAAMTVAAQGDALIIDLRENGGGAETSNLLMGYLVPPGSPLAGTYDRPTDTHRHFSSPDWVPGRRFGDTKPIYVLVSRKTFSAAEAVAYNLQALKRATIIGERTGGGAHPFEFRPVHAHFALDLPEGRSIHPLTNRNWQGVGVKPDIEVAAADALAVALTQARNALRVSAPKHGLVASFKLDFAK